MVGTSDKGENKTSNTGKTVGEDKSIRKRCPAKHYKQRSGDRKNTAIEEVQ